MFLTTDRYKIFFEKTDFAYLADFLENTCKAKDVLILADENTAQFCLPKIRPIVDKKGFELFTFPAGEHHKNLDTTLRLWHEMMDRQIRRNTLVINLGGGVATDLGGFCAAVFKRGLPFIHIPTSLLCMLDAAVGSKTGVDFAGQKNMIGSFTDPQAVFIWPGFLETLPEEHLNAGMAEAWKHALIDNRGLWNLLRDGGTDKYERLIFKSLEIKRKIVDRDPREMGERKKLNFGHTVGHAFESWYLNHGQAPIHHGNAVAAGMIVESHLAWKSGKLDKLVFDEIRETLHQYFPHLSIPTSEIPVLLEYMANDKKKDQDKLNFVLLEDIGEAIINQCVEECVVSESLSYYLSLF